MEVIKMMEKNSSMKTLSLIKLSEKEAVPLETIKDTFTVNDMHLFTQKLCGKNTTNMSYLCLVNLIKENYVDRVITTNFDRCLKYACSLLNVYPEFYNMAMVNEIDHNYLYENAVYYLHGSIGGGAKLGLANYSHFLDILKKDK